jgi:hypothetical protein
MAVPVFLSAPLRYKKITITDVADIITTLRDELVTQPAAENKWTEPVSGTFQSPARSDGAFLTLAATKITATRIAYVVKDHNGVQVNYGITDTRQDINTSATDVHIHTSPLYVIVDSVNVAQTECWGCGIMDRTPEPLADPRPCYWASGGPRNTAGAVADNSFLYVWTNYIGSVNPYTKSYNNIITLRTPNKTYCDKFTMTGTLLFLPVEFISDSWFLGRAFNLLITDGTQNDQGTFDVPLDDGTIGTFRILGWNIVDNGKVCVRVA